VRRSAHLAPLSRDHHVTLAHALRLRRASADELPVTVARFLAFFVDEGQRHFAQEEAVLAPELPDAHVLRLQAEHADIRARAAALGEDPDGAAARALGELLTRHVRYEERELFPLLESTLPPERLVEVGERLALSA
jgi:hemerythrin-like domain-containing protein